MLALAAAPASAASGDIDPGTYVANGSVNAIVTASDGSIYLGGHFSSVGPQTGSGLILEPSSSDVQPVALGPGEPDDSAFPKVAGGSVRAAVADGGGGWYIGGDFSFVGGQQRQGLAHIQPGGILDGLWDPGVSGGGVDALAFANGILYVGGNFTAVGGQPRSGVAAVDTDANVTAWNPVSDGEVRALALSPDHSTVYAGGQFSSIGGQSRSNVAALDADGVGSGTGDATAWDANANDAVDALAVSPSDGTVYAGGSFAGTGSIGGGDRDYIAALTASDGGIVSGWAPDASDAVHALAISPDAATLYVGGSFSGPGSISGADRDHLAALHTSTGSATAWDPGANGTVRSLAVSTDGSNVYAGGDFAGSDSVNGADRNHVVAIDAVAAAVTTWNPNPDDAVLALATSAGGVYAGGSFVTAGPKVAARANLARLQPDGTLDMSWRADSDGPVDALALSPDGSKLYVGGDFAQLAGAARDRLGALTAASGSLDAAWHPDADADVRALAVSPDGATIYAGGSFSALTDGTNTLAGSFLGAVDSGGVLKTAWDPSPDAAVASLAVSDDGSTVFAGGDFGLAGGQSRAGLAALDAASGDALPGTGWAPPSGSYPSGPRALRFDSGSLLAGGGFSDIGGASRSELAALDPDTGDAGSWDPGVCCGGVDALATNGGIVFAGGTFASAGASAVNNLAAVDELDGRILPWSPTPDGGVNALATSPDGRTAYVGGAFAEINGFPAAHFAAIDVTPVGLSPTPHESDFGTQVIGGSSSPQTFTITNDGLRDLVISSVQVAGPDQGEFAIDSDSCSSSTVPAGSSCSVDVTFDPVTTGPKTAELEFSDNAAGSPQDLALTGIGQANGPDAALAPSSHAFGSRQTGTGSSAAQAFTLTNTGISDLTVSTVGLAGADPGQFTIGTDDCSGTIVPAGDSCTVSVAFAPSTAGAKSAQLQIDDDAPSPRQVASLTGTGTAPAPGGGSGPGAAPPQSPTAATPDTRISKGPAKSTKSHSAAFVFSATAVASFQCKVDAKPFVACRSPFSLKRVKAGRHLFQVRAVGASGTDSSPASYSWKVKKKPRR